MNTTPAAKFPWLHLVIALAVTGAYAALTYKLAAIDAYRRFGTSDDAMASAYIQGQFIGAFILPAIVCGIACIPKGRNKSRILKSYWITCAILCGIHLTGYLQQIQRT